MKRAAMVSAEAVIIKIVIDSGVCWLKLQCTEHFAPWTEERAPGEGDAVRRLALSFYSSYVAVSSLWASFCVLAQDKNLGMSNYIRVPIVYIISKTDIRSTLRNFNMKHARGCWYLVSKKINFSHSSDRHKMHSPNYVQSNFTLHCLLLMQPL